MKILIYAQALWLALMFSSNKVVAQPMKDGLWEITFSSEIKMGGNVNRMPPNTMRKCVKKEELKSMSQGRQETNPANCRLLREERRGDKLFLTQECKNGGVAYVYNSTGIYKENYMEVNTEMSVKGSKDVSKSVIIAKRIGDCK